MMPARTKKYILPKKVFTNVISGYIIGIVVTE